MDENTFGKRLKKYRGDKTQTKVAELLDISVTFYRGLETGERLPSYKTLKKITEITHIDANYWLGITDVRSAEPTSDIDNPRIKQNIQDYEIISLLAQLRAELEKRKVHTAADKKMLQELLASCQRTFDIASEIKNHQNIA